MANEWVIRSRVGAYVSASIDDFADSKGLGEVRRQLDVSKIIPCKGIVVKLEIRYLRGTFAWKTGHATVVIEIIVNRNIRRGRRRIRTIDKLIPGKEIFLKINSSIRLHSASIPVRRP